MEKLLLFVLHPSRYAQANKGCINMLARGKGELAFPLNICETFVHSKL